MTHSLLVLLSFSVFGPHSAPSLAAGTALRLLSPRTAVEGEVKSGVPARHHVAAAAGQYLRLTVEPPGIAVTATLLDPAGKVVAEVRTGGAEDAPLRICAIVERSGLHELKLARPRPGAPPVSYRVTLEPLRIATQDDPLRVRAARAYAEAGRLGIESFDNSSAVMKWLEEARELWHRVGDASEEADALVTEAGVWFNQGSSREAMEAVRRALALHQAAGDRRGEASTLNNLGVAAWSLGDARAALGDYERALPIAHELGLVRLEASILSNMGTAYKNLGDTRKALAFYERSLPLRRQARDVGGQATSLSNIGVAYRMLGNHRRALSAYEEALPLARAERDTGAESAALQNLGALCLSVGDVERSEEFLGQALALARRTADRRGRAVVLGWLSHAQRLKGNLPEAVSLGQQELALWRSLGDRYSEGAALTALGSLQRLQGARETAEETLTEALRLQRELGDRFDEVHSQLELAGLAQDAGDLELAGQGYTEALRASRALSDPGAEATALFRLARLHRAQGDLDEARRNVEAALAVQESLRKSVAGPRWRASFFVSAQDAYEFLIDVLMTMDAARPGQGLAAEALRASERKRARSLLDALPGTEVDADSASQGESTRVGDLQALLDDRTALLEFSLGESASYAWVVTREGIHSARLAPKARIAAAARAYYDRVAAPPSSRGRSQSDRGATAAAGGELTRLLLAPLAEYLDRERVAIVPDGSLQYVPFALLPEPHRGGDAAAAPMVAGHEMVSLPSATALQRLRANSRASRNALVTVAVLADPVFEVDDPRVSAPGRGRPAAAAPLSADLLRAAHDVGLASGARRVFPRLPYSRQEAAAIAAAAGRGGVLSALDFDASRSTALSSRLAAYDVVHFATHGIVDDARPDLSGLVLSLIDRRGRAQDGFLRLHDIDALRLPVSLVVLSGCRTALGKDVRGEGLLGIVRAFMRAGAPRVVASLWEVDDRATAAFMREFYQALVVSGRSPAAALREAQLALRSRERWRDPFYWAGFVLQGEWN
jgi:CHAT domain-containing protein/tetratricopeptide (TPR) repeat protein